MADDRLKSSGATYSQAAEGYFEKRQLKRTAGYFVRLKPALLVKPAREAPLVF